MERLISYDFLIDFESIQHKLSSDYTLNIYVSRAVFPLLMVHHFLHINLYKMSIFERSVTCSFFFQELYSLLKRNQGENFGDMLVKIANKVTVLNIFSGIPVISSLISADIFN